jgi:starvation-inducible DNA-binding protein
MTVHDSVPGLDAAASHRAAEILQERLDSTIDLHLTLKHVHWNVVGPNFIGVHQMLDDQVGPARAMSDELAERIATLGAQPEGTPGGVVKRRTWDDYGLGRASTQDHLAALDEAYDGIIADHRVAQAELADIDPVSEDLILGQLRQLELFQWFVRSHVETGR